MILLNVNILNNTNIEEQEVDFVLKREKEQLKKECYSNSIK